MGVRNFFRQFIPIINRDDLWEAQFNLAYNSNGGINLETIQQLKKKKFLYLLRKLAKTKKEENKAIKEASKGSAPTKSNSKGMRYLGKL